MAAFFRGFLVFLFGAIAGAGGVLFFTPSFHVVVSRSGAAAKPIEIASAPAPVVTPVAPAAPKAVAPVTTPAPAVVAAPAPAAPVVAATSAVAAAEPAIDFKSISEHLILWPTSVTVKAATTVTVLADGKKVQDLALDAGTVLQVSKVLADGSLEARAKGAKFEIKSSLTDFSVELGKRVAELVAKGTKLEPFGLSAPAPAAMAPTATPASAAVAPVAPAPAVAAEAVAPKPWARLTLAQRVDVLFGNKPDAVVPAATVAPVTSVPASAAPAASAPAATPAPAAVTPAAPVVEAAPAADPKAAEKGKDLDRKMNQLFK